MQPHTLMHTHASTPWPAGYITIAQLKEDLQKHLGIRMTLEAEKILRQTDVTFKKLMLALAQSDDTSYSQPTRGAAGQSSVVPIR